MLTSMPGTSFLLPIINHLLVVKLPFVEDLIQSLLLTCSEIKFIIVTASLPRA